MTAKTARRRRKPSATTARAGALGRQALVRYWVVLSYADARDLLCGVLPPDVARQLIEHVHPAPAESRAEYLARLDDYAAERVRV